jgi:UDP-3-O-[3-hydroxymyristoyl] glucosamine N-acyltransferase
MALDPQEVEDAPARRKAALSVLTSDREVKMTRTAGELAEYLNAQLEGPGSALLSGVASPERARAADLIYVDSARHSERAAASASGCVVAPPGTRFSGKTILESPHPKFAFAKAAAWLAQKPAPQASIHATAIISASAKIAAQVFVGPYVVVEDGAEIGARTTVDAFCFLGRDSRIGEDCRLHPRVTLYAGAHLGNRVEVHSGAVIGADGFGYVFGEGRQLKFPQIGAVEIADDVEIGANTTIDRGSLEDTQIGRGVKIDNLVQIAHNVRIGEHSVIAAQTGISGSSALGRGVVVGGQVGIGDHCEIQDGAVLGGQAGILAGKVIRVGQTVWGTPARPLEKFKEQHARFARLPELAERVRRLEEEH